MSESFELVRRVIGRGGRVQYEVRNAFGRFKPTPYNRWQAINRAEQNLVNSRNTGAYGDAEFQEVLNEAGIEYDTALIDEIVNNSDDIEINLELQAIEEGVGTAAVETTPLLGAAGGGAATASGSGIAGGAAIAGGAIVAGTALGVGLNVATNWGTDEYNPSPGRHYLGPGNTLSGRVPVDSADEIAKYHDELYEVAASYEDISRADVIAIDRFKTDFERTGNWGSFLGRFGLGLKKAFEDRFGVVYPSALPSHHLVPGMADRERIVVKTRFDPAKDIYTDRRYLSLNRGQQNYARSQWNIARQNRNLPRVWPPHAQDQNTMRPPVDRQGNRRTNFAVPYHVAFPPTDQIPPPRTINTPEQIENLPGFEGIQPVAGPSGVKRPAPAAIGEVTPPKRARPVGQVVSEMASGTRSQQANNVMSQPMEEEEVPAPPVPAPNAVATADIGGPKGVSSAGGFDSATGPDPYIRTPRYTSKGGYQTYTKVHHIRTKPLPYTVLNPAGATAGTKWIVTPLAEIPWDRIYFYMSQAEFNLIPAGSRALKCKIHVQHLTSNTQFETGGDTVQTSTTNNAKILLTGFDLPKAMRGGRTLTVTVGADLKPTAVANVTRTTFPKWQYGVNQLNTDWDTDLPGEPHGIPYYTNDHFCIYQPNKAAAATDFAGTNACGYESFVSCVTQTNMNDHAWSGVFEREYSFSSAPIGEPYKSLEILNTAFTQQVGSGEYYNMKRAVSAVAGNMTITETIDPSAQNGVQIVDYTSPIEKGAFNIRGDACFKPARQPTFHIGMKAIDKQKTNLNTPRAEEFVAGTAYFVVTATIDIQLPSYPNRFNLPGRYNVSLENHMAGVSGRRPVSEQTDFVTFGLGNSEVIPPLVREPRSATEPDPKRRRPTTVVN